MLISLSAMVSFKRVSLIANKSRLLFLVTVIRTQQGSIILIYLTELFLIRNEIILAVRKKICSLPSSDGCSSGVGWLFGVKIPSTLLERGVGEVDVVFGIHIFFEIGKGHYYEITTIFTFFLSLGITPLLVTRYCVTLFSNTLIMICP